MAVIIRTKKLPKELDYTDAYSMLLKEMRAYEKALLLDYKATTVTWVHQPVFESDVLILPDIASVKVWTDDEIYGYVDEGTKGPYPIPKGTPKKRLAFKVGGTPKTIPNADTAGPGAPGTKLVVLPLGRKVMHPGIKARNFTKNIRKYHESDFYNRMRRAIRQWIRQSGYAVK